MVRLTPPAPADADDGGGSGGGGGGGVRPVTQDNARVNRVAEMRHVATGRTPSLKGSPGTPSRHHPVAAAAAAVVAASAAGGGPAPRHPPTWAGG